MPITLSGDTGITTPTYNGNTTAEYLVPVTAFKNRLINGQFQIDQRNAGASGTATGYTLDRWQYNASQASRLTWQQNAGSVTPPVGFSNYYGLTTTSAFSVAASDFFRIMQVIEGFNCADLAWGTANASPVTLSFWVRSSLTGTFGGCVQNAATTRSYPFTYTISVANTWEYKTITIAGDTTGSWPTNNGGCVQVQFGLGVGSTFSGTAGSWSSNNFVSATGATSVVGTNGATFYLTGVQLEKGSTATSFDYRPYGTELSLCQRYFQLAGGAASGSFDASTTVIQITEKLNVPMRTAPTAAIASSGYASFRSQGADFNNGAPVLANFTASITTAFWTQVTGFVSGTANAVVTGRNTNANNNFIALSAEL